MVAAALRFIHIGWSFSNNGIDEGIMVERSLLVSRGYSLYAEIPCDQAPLAFLVGSLLDGDVVSLRTLVAGLSMIAIVACMWASRTVKGDRAMLITGALLAVDFTFLRESRLFSLDAISGVFMAFSAVAFILYLRGSGRAALAGAGLLAGLATSTKLFGALGVLALLIFLAYELLKRRSEKKRLLVDIMIVVGTSVLPMALLLVYLGPSDMLDGMLFNQGHREFVAFLKLSVLAYFALNLGYVIPLIYARKAWTLSPETRFLLLSAVLILGFIALQPLTFLHHLAVVSPLFAMLAGILLGDWVQWKKVGVESDADASATKKRLTSGNAFLALIMAGIVVSAGLGSYGILFQGKPTQVAYADRLREATLPDDWVVSGDPLIPAYADRMVPPEAVNVAYRVYPVVTEDDLERTILEYNVSVVIVCYRLNEMPGLESFLASHGYTYMTAEWGGGEEAVLDIFQEGLGHISVWTDAEATARLGALTSCSS